MRELIKELFSIIWTFLVEEVGGLFLLLIGIPVYVGLTIVLIVILMIIVGIGEKTKDLILSFLRHLK